jgi:hypothetical protein
MVLGRTEQIVGDRTQYTVDCSAWLATGETLTGVTCVVDIGTATVDTIVINGAGTGFTYFINAGTLGDQYNAIFEQVTSLTQIR